MELEQKMVLKPIGANAEMFVIKQQWQQRLMRNQTFGQHCVEL